MQIFGIDVSAWILIILTAAQLLYTALMYHGDRARVVENSAKPPRRPLVIIGLFMLLTWAAVGFDYYDRHYGQLPPLYVDDWGIGPGDVFYAIFNSAPLVRYKSDHKVLLILRVPYADIDPMTDTAIAKSDAYSITGQEMTLAKAKPTLRAQLGKMINVDYYVVLLPSDIPPEKISSIGDIERFRGNILATRSTTVQLPK